MISNAIRSVNYRPSAMVSIRKDLLRSCRVDTPADLKPLESRLNVRRRPAKLKSIRRLSASRTGAMRRSAAGRSVTSARSCRSPTSRPPPTPFASLPVRSTSLSEFGLGGEDGVRLSLDDVLRKTSTDGIVILHNDHVVFEAYDHGLTPHAPHIIMSATKSIVGLVTGILQASGDLDLDAPVAALSAGDGRDGI